MSTRREQALAEAFVGLSDTLVADYDVIDLLHRLSDACTELLVVEAAGLLLSDQRGNLQVLASSTEATRLLELFELQNNEGPCLECFRTGEPAMSTNLDDTEGYWPRFATQARNQGFRSVYALPMRLRTQTIGALNLFCTQPAALPEGDLQIAQALANVATIAILQERALRRGEVVAEQLQAALNSRVIIEQAKGVLAAHGQLDMNGAFAQLRQHARVKNLRLSDLARAVVEGTTQVEEVLGGNLYRTT
jgi:transcriptional regulator with GAF, ATPase, and Fis domain